MDCQIADQVFAVLRRLQDAQKYPRDYGTGEPLYYAEVIFLDTVYRSPEANVSQLSALLGTTKGAVTQMAGKLTDKGLIELYRREGNKKEKYYRLTPLGETARTGHARFHEDSNARLCEYFSSLGPEDSAVILDFLNILQDCAPFTTFSCKHGSHRTE